MANQGIDLEHLRREREQIEHQLGELRKHFKPTELLRFATAKVAINDLELKGQRLLEEDYIELERRCLELARTELVDLERDPTSILIPRMAAYGIDQRIVAAIHSVIPAAEYAARILALGIDFSEFAAYIGYKDDRGVRRQANGQQSVTGNALAGLEQLEHAAEGILATLESEAEDEGAMTIFHVPSNRRGLDKGVIPEAVYAAMAGRLFRHYPDAKVVYA